MPACALAKQRCCDGSMSSCRRTGPAFCASLRGDRTTRPKIAKRAESRCIPNCVASSNRCRAAGTWSSTHRRRSATRWADRPLNQSTWLKRLKQLCAQCGFANPNQYKLHTFRHAFASMCARTNVAYKYALSWLGHSSSEILDLYYKQFDDVADEAMRTINYISKPLRSNDLSTTTKEGEFG